MSLHEWQGADLLRSKETIPGERGKNLLRYLLYDIPWTEDLSRGMKAHISGKRSLYPELKKATQEAFDELLPKLEKAPVECGEIAIHSLLSYYALFEPKTREEIAIPCRVNEKWERVPFRVERLSLCPPFHLPAFYLTPQREGVQPILLFQGSKRLLHWLSDFFPCTSPGAFLFMLSNERIRGWLNKSGLPARCVGMSLGGSLALFTAAHFPEKAEAFALVSPGLYFPQKAKGVVVIDPKDLASDVGYFPRELRVFKIKRSYGALLSHLRIFGALPFHAEEVLPNVVNREWSRLPVTLLKEGASFLLFPVLVALALITPVIKTMHRMVRWIFTPG